MRPPVPLVTLLVVAACVESRPTDGPGERTVPAAVVAGTLSDPLLGRLSALAPDAIGPALPECAAIVPALRRRLRPTTPASARTADGATALARTLDEAAGELETPIADADLAAAVRELAASLRDLAAALRAFAEAFVEGDEPAVRALGARFENGVGNAEASVAKAVQRCAADQGRPDSP